MDAVGLRLADGVALLGAYRLESTDPSFGGFSAIETDGRVLWLLSDRAVLWQAPMTLDGHTGDIAFGEWRKGAVVGDAGDPEAGDHGALDSEALAITADGGLIAAFEHDNSVRRLTPTDGGWRAERLHAGPLIPGTPRNEGIEALAATADGSLLVLAEGLEEPEGVAVGAVLAAGTVEPFGYRSASSFGPVAAATADQDLYVLERSLSLLGGWQSRLGQSRLPATDTLEGKPLMRLDYGPLAENYEGLAVLPEADGSRLILLISDDNQTVLQRTLLLVLRQAG